MEVIEPKAAREYVLANYPNDPLLKHMAITLLEQLPKVDAVEVVRCKDCEFWNEGWFPECKMGKCKRGKTALTEPYHYCGYGVRRPDIPAIIKDESFVVKEDTEI